MTRDAAGQIIRNDWWKVVAIAFGLGGSIMLARSHEMTQDAVIAEKADADQVARLTFLVERVDTRLRHLVCGEKPAYLWQ